MALAPLADGGALRVQTLAKVALLFSRPGRTWPPATVTNWRLVMNKLVVTTLAALCVALGFAAEPVRAGPGCGKPTFYQGVIHHPRYGNVRYVYDPATTFVYFPSLGTGGYLSAGRSGYYAPGQTYGYYGPYSGFSGSLGSWSTNSYFGSVVGGPNGAVGFNPPAGSGPGTGSVLFGPGGPVYSHPSSSD
jgi:hypothetical protein